jgi:hypothetical protein
VLLLQPIPALQITQDRDADMGSEFFETRQAFLSLCQGNHYQVRLETRPSQGLGVSCSALYIGLVSFWIQICDGLCQ